jgi:hypothetical protein
MTILIWKVSLKKDKYININLYILYIIILYKNLLIILIIFMRSNHKTNLFPFPYIIIINKIK